MPVVPVDPPGESYRLLFDKNPLPMVVFDRETLVFLAVNDAAVRYFGYTRAEFLDRTAPDVWAPENRSYMAQAGRKAAERQQRPTGWRGGTWRHRNKDGTVITAQVTATPITFQGRDAVLAVANAGTERPQADRALPHAQVVNILETVSDTFIALDPEWRFTYLNRHALTEAGAPLEDLVGSSIWERFPELLGTPVEDHYRRAMAERTPVHFQTRGVRTGRWLEVHVYPSSEGLTIYGRDITAHQQAAESLRQSEERHRLIAELASDYAYTCQVDADGNIRMDSVTEGFERVTGYTLKELQAQGDWMSLIHPDDLAGILSETPTLLTGQRTNAEVRIVTKDRVVRWIRYTAQPTTDPEQGQVTRLLGAVQDITPLKQAEDELRQANQVLASIIYACPLAIIAIDPDGRVTAWNPAAERIFGWLREEVLSQPLPIIPPGQEAVYRAFRAAELRGESRSASELRRLRKDGRLVDVSVWTAPVRDASSAVCSTIGIVADITDRKQAEGQLRDQAERLQTLSRRLLEVQEQERRHFARELHDEVGQELTGLKLALEACTQKPAEHIRAGLASVLALVQELTTKVRELSLRLRPTMLDDLGLLPALLWHVERYTAQTGLRVKFEHRGLDRRLYPPEVETAAFRIVQEALTNVARHARIKSVAVRLWLEEDRLLIRVEDQGAGFEPGDIRAAAPSGGLSGMRERATLVGGQLEVQSARGCGTCVTASLPIQGFEDRRRPAFEQFADR